MANETDRIMAMASLLQSCLLIRQIARHGEWDEQVAATCIYSLFQMDADSVTDVYGDYQGLQSGLKYLKNILQHKIERADIEITRYALSLLHLERKLIEKRGMLDKIRQQLYAIQNEFNIRDITNTTLHSRIADIYVSTISTIPPKIQVEGEREYLAQISNTWRVRTLLFCGIRSAVLWRQLGGTRWGLFWGRKRILRTIDHMLEM